LIPCPAKEKKKKRTINKELKTNTQYRGKGAVSTPEKGEGQRVDLCTDF
jgi:hypothetical protein